MAKKKHKAPAQGAVWHLSSVEATQAKMPKYNGFACGYGAHGSAKYDRNAMKRRYKKELDSSSFGFLFEK